MKLPRPLAEAALTAASLIVPRLAAAQGQITEQQLAIPLITNQPLIQIVNRVLQAVLIIAGLIALAYLLYGGFAYITAGGDEEKAGSGRKAITNAIIGIIIIIAAFAILRFVVARVGQTGVG